MVIDQPENWKSTFKRGHIFGKLFAILSLGSNFVSETGEESIIYSLKSSGRRHGTAVLKGSSLLLVAAIGYGIFHRVALSFSVFVW